jgi:glutamine synthetase
MEQPDDDAAHPGGGPIEDRTVDGACNPYLAATAVLAAGLDGIENGIDPGDPSTGSMYETSVEDRKKMGVETLPENLLDATRALEEDEVLRKALGRARDEDYSRLLRSLQAARVAAGTRADHEVGDRPVPAARLRARVQICAASPGLFSKSKRR